MAIIQSCCCWRTVRRGSFACAIYSGIYFVLILLTTLTLLINEEEYLSGNRSKPESSSFLEPNTISVATVGFNGALFICSCCGIVSCFLLIYGLFRNEKYFLLPWISTVVTCNVTDISYSLYLFCFVALGFNPITALVYTLDFFLLCLNIYSVLCVISQYQEYSAGRGTSQDDENNQTPAIHYVIQPTPTTRVMTSCLSARRSGENVSIKATTPVVLVATSSGSCSPSATTLLPEGTNSTSRQTLPNAVRKHVQFPDTLPDTRNLYNS